MEIEFATCERRRALEFIQKVYPSRKISEEDISELLDFVEKDVVRIQDPMMYGNIIGVVPGRNWDESLRDAVVKAGRVLTAHEPNGGDDEK